MVNSRSNLDLLTNRKNNMSKKNKTMSEEITNEGVSISHFQENIKANDNLKEILKLALKQTSTTTREVLPKLSNAVVSYIKEFKDNLKNQIYI